jgi:thiamine-monophosphate kinase
MLLSQLGEFGLIDKFKKMIRLDPSVIKGTGDDCAVLKLDKHRYQLFTCDMLVEGVDFHYEENPCLIGRKSLAVSISDIAACGGLPRYCLASLGMPGDTSVEFVNKLIRGMLDIAKKYKINIVGGDLSRSGRLVIDISMLGIVEKRCLVLRSGAKIGDKIFVTGSLGGSILGRHLSFVPRIEEARLLVKKFKLNSMIDISDGLAQDLGHILTESKVGAIIYQELIPINKQAKGLADALYSGEDFELLFTLSHKESKKIIKNKSLQVQPIGEIVDKNFGFRMVDKSGKEKIIQPKGFRHF